MYVPEVSTNLESFCLDFEELFGVLVCTLMFEPVDNFMIRCTNSANCIPGERGLMKCLRTFCHSSFARVVATKADCGVAVCMSPASDEKTRNLSSKGAFLATTFFFNSETDSSSFRKVTLPKTSSAANSSSSGRKDIENKSDAKSSFFTAERLFLRPCFDRFDVCWVSVARGVLPTDDHKAELYECSLKVSPSSFTPSELVSFPSPSLLSFAALSTESKPLCWSAAL
mmetsp:Transcript_10046/g.19134  ORF Transcript_10046/g.19134 Transcript_10046/m.19134 type:complete len:227 (+) Transcript_10046:2042-2722(+)